MNVYFNEIDPFCAEWLRNQFAATDTVAGVEIDGRDICTIERPTDAVRQHYFAGLGGWEWALRLAGWPEDQEVWTGSVPCQPFSVAGKQAGVEDERHLWPAFHKLIALGTPAIVLGEQVPQAIQFGWIDGVFDSLEDLGYACAATILSAASVGAPHIRQRLYWVAIRLDDAGWLRNQRGREAGDIRSPQGDAQDSPLQRQRDGDADSDSGATGGLANSAQRGQRIHGSTSGHPGHSELGSETIGLGDSDRTRPQGRSLGLEQRADQLSAWAASDLVYCRDGRTRRIPLEPSFQPLADGGRFGNPRIDSNVSSRIGALKGSGNAIVIPLAAEFVRAVIDIYFGQPAR